MARLLLDDDVDLPGIIEMPNARSGYKICEAHYQKAKIMWTGFWNLKSEID